ncbi:unnamed protein product, partial [marine sediment metagenome]
MQLFNGDCLEIMPDIPAGSVDLVFVDPPYNIKKAEWDKIENYQAWCESWVAECSRVLKPNGAFWVSHSISKVLALISAMIERHGRDQVNWIIWDKYNGGKVGGTILDRTLQTGIRMFATFSEYLIYHADEGEWKSQCDKERGFIFEPLRQYLEKAVLKAGWTKAQLKWQWMKERNNKSEMPRHWLEQKQFELPTRENYQWLRKHIGNTNLCREYEDLRHEYEDLRREYEDLRREYEDLRYTFNNPGKMSSVWQIPPAKANGHPTP